MRNKQIIKIIIICIVILLIALIATLIVYFSTDLLKPANKLFQKYLKNDMENIENIIDISSDLEYINFLQQKNYNDSTDITLEYTNSMQNQEHFKINILGSTDNQTHNSYRKANIVYGENVNVSNIEFLQENTMYGLLFEDVVKQFASVDMAEKSTALERLHIDEKQIDNFMDQYKIKDIITLIKDKRENVKNVIYNFMNNIESKQYSSQKDRLITLSDGQSITTRLFTLKLSEDQTKRMIRDILRELGDNATIDEIYANNVSIPQLTVSLYIVDGKIIRIDMNFGKSIRIDLINNTLDIEYNNNAETVEEQHLIKINIKNKNGTRTINYTDNKNNNYIIETKLNEEENKMSANINLYIQNNDIKGLQIGINQLLEINNNIQIEKKFGNIPNYTLNKLQVNVVNVAISSLFDLINNRLQNIQDINVHSEAIDKWIELNKNLATKYQTIQENRENRFNNQFLLYQGQNVDKSVIYNLINIAGRNILNYEYNDNNEVKIYLKEGNIDEDKITELKKIIDNAKNNYNVSFEYDSDGRITVILLEQYQKID